MAGESIQPKAQLALGDVNRPLIADCGRVRLVLKFAELKVRGRSDKAFGRGIGPSTAESVLASACASAAWLPPG